MDDKNILMEYVRMLKAEINGRIYIDKELFIALIDKRLMEEKKDCESAEEKNGIDICRNILANI